MAPISVLQAHRGAILGATGVKMGPGAPKRCAAVILMPGVTFSSLMVSTDVPLIFFSALIALISIKLYQNRSLNKFYYIALAIIFSFGLLSKYAILFLPISYFIAIILLKDIRILFINKKFFISIFIAFILISPHIVWNINNGFVTFSHTADNANFNNIQMNLIQGITFIASQMIIFGIIPFYIIVIKIKVFNKLSTLEKLAFINFITPIVIIMSLAIISRANANWAVIGYPFGCIFLASIFSNKNKKNTNLCLTNQLLFSVLLILILTIKIPTFFDPMYRHAHVRELSMNLKMLLQSTQQAGFIADDREDYAHMLYYLKDLNIPKAKWNGDNKIDDHYELTTNVDNLKGKNVILLTRTMPTQAMIDRCAHYEKLKSLEINYKTKTRTFNIYIMRNWR